MLALSVVTVNVLLLRLRLKQRSAKVRVHHVVLLMRYKMKCYKSDYAIWLNSC